MRIILITCLLFAKNYFAFTQNTITVDGLGDIFYSKHDTGYTIDMGNLGTFDFNGTIQPLDLSTKVTANQLNEFPGFQVLEALELEEMTLKLKPNSCTLEGKADTKKKLKTLCEAFNIQAPFIHFVTQINTQKIAISGELDFLSDPLVVDVSKEIGTRFILQKIMLFATLGYDKTALPSLAVTTNMKIRPTTKDNDMASELKLSYNLLTSEITGVGSLNDTWKDPLGISKIVGIKSDAISIANSAISLAWLPALSTPSGLGFASEKAKFFNLEFLTKIALSLTNQQLALQGHRNQMMMKDFVWMLKEGFGLQVPKDLFPDNMIFQDVDILFSPNGGKMGDYKIDKGFLYKGGIQYSEVVSGNAFFKANSKDSISLDMNLQGFDKILEAKINKGKDTELDKALKQALSTLQIKKLKVHLEADKNLNLVGLTQCTLVVFEKEMNFSFDATLNPDKIANNILQKMGKAALDHLSKNKKK